MRSKHSNPTHDTTVHNAAVISGGRTGPINPQATPFGTNKGDTLEERMKNYNAQVEQDECNKDMTTGLKTVIVLGITIN